VVLTDGNAMMEPDVIRLVVRHFADETVGGVCGRFEARNLRDTSVGEGGKVYWEIERSLRKRESDVDSCIHMSGEITALRRAVFVNADETSLAEDFEMAVDLRRRGYRIIYEPDAVVFEPAPTNVRDLTTRKKRIVTGTWQTLAKHRSMLFNPKYGWYGVVILPSHKLLQACTPLLLSLVTVSTLAAYLFSKNPAIMYFLALQAACYALTALSFVATRISIFRKFRPFVFLKYFATLNLACVMGFVDFVRGERVVTWEKIESSREF